MIRLLDTFPPRVLAALLAASGCAAPATPAPPATPAIPVAATPPAAPAPPPTAAPPAKPSQTTRLSDAGCGVELPGVWKRVPATDPKNASWEAHSEDGAQTVTVLAMPGRSGLSRAEQRSGLEATMNIRRHVDARGRGGKAMLSETEFVDDPTGPAAFYTLVDPDEGVAVATLAKASPDLECVFLLLRDDARAPGFREYARSVLATVKAGR